MQPDDASLNQNRKGLVGWQNPLTEEQKQLVYTLLAGGMQIRAVVKKTGFCMGTVQSLKREYNARKAEDRKLTGGGLMPNTMAPRRTLTIDQVIEIAKHSVRGLSEKEACELIGAPWNKFKALKYSNPTFRQRFDDLCDKYRGERIDEQVGNIEGAAAKDWRAADRLLAIAAPERFNRESQVTVDNRQSVTVLADENTAARLLQSIYGSDATQPAIEAPSEAKLLPEDSDHDAPRNSVEDDEDRELLDGLSEQAEGCDVD